ncbi:hypothetical protein [Nguyenibacter vanlangensis]|uniref:Uncharacterized protein n=1 Tax=Nguyenibacter vanlangensis TaxID=1216886 RepID=A0A7Y7IVH0_9PROT|nr:hypothetical protein [Nguyenibacter vanlangensis]NVN10828.1 hypothetical protein [Nguyenibacter vanlangensis]
MKATADMLNNRYKLLTKAVEQAVGAHKEYNEDRQGRRVLARTWMPEQVRERVRAANAPFAVPV